MARNKLHPIPHPPRTPVLGNMLTVDGDAPIQDLMRITREQGPIFWLDMMGAPIVIVSGADLVDEYHLYVHPVLLGAGTPLFPAGHRRRGPSGDRAG